MGSAASLIAPLFGPSSSTTLPSSSTCLPPSSSSASWTYEVFLSFRGEDTRKTFVDHLYAALDRHGIRTFKDDKRLRGGKSISPQLLNAIKQSRTAIIVFSTNYASSSWCLDELAVIMECQKVLSLTVFPVFYDVDPSEVRRQSGIFGEGFSKALRRNADKERIWKKALEKAAELSGLDVRKSADGHESQCIKLIIEWFWSNIPSNISFDENLIGMKPRVLKLMSLLRRDLDDVQMIGIWGMGGSGKTTVARVVFDEISKQFDGASFIDNVREKASHESGLPCLQEKILKNIFMEKELELVDSVHQGIQTMKQRLRNRKVLIVLDDVGHVDQLDALAGASCWFGNGSRIIITTRDRHLLVAHGIEKIHSVDLLIKEECIQLFKRYAFKNSNPTKRHDELSLAVVHYAAGLPLALKVLGSFLCGRGIDQWDSALERLKKVSEKDILEILKISYDGLQDTEKELFLDIACLFKGWRKDEAFEILDSCGFDPGIGIDVLVDRSLITFPEGRFHMHDLIQEMGREISERSRPWRWEDIQNALENNMGTEVIKAIVIDTTYFGRVIEGTKVIVSQERIGTILGHRLRKDLFKCDTESFRSMKKLRVFDVRHSFPDRYPYRISCDVGGLEYLPNELQWLNWDGYIHESLPECFQAPKLVQLRMHCSCIVQLWKEKKYLKELKVLDLSGSRKLICCPDFSGMPKLETLILRECSSLVEIHPSIGYLQRLVRLDLSRCTNLMDLPHTICTLKSLKMIDLRGCKSLKKLPENLGRIVSLEELDLGVTSVRQVPFSIVLLKNLKHMSFVGCKILEDSMGTPLGPLFQSSCLKVLNLNFCGLSEGAIPVNIGSLSSLEKLYLRGSQFAFLPSSISQLSHLKILDLSDCKELKALPELPSSIAILMAEDCMSLENVDVLDRSYEWLWKFSSTIAYNKCDQCEQEAITGQGCTLCKSDLCWSHWKKLRELPAVGDILLPNMLQGNALVNHQFSIRYTKEDCAMPMWFREGVVEEAGNQVVLELPPNWQNVIAGFTMCCVGLSSWTDLRISLTGSKVFLPLSEEYDPRHHSDVWVGYISLNRLRRSYEGVMPTDWMDRTTQLFLKFKAEDIGPATACGARLVFKKDVPSKVTSSSFTCTDPHQIDSNFAAETTVKCVNYWENGICLRFITDFVDERYGF